MERLDTIVKNGRLIDPAQGVDAVRHIGIAGGKVVMVSETPIAASADRTIDAAGAYVAPGFIDLHAHVFHGSLPSTHADHSGLANGVTTVVDAGSAGWMNFNTFRDYVVPSYASRVLAYVHVSATGLSINRVKPEMHDILFAQPERAAQAVRANPGFATGVKVRIARTATGEDPANAREALRRARLAADLAGSSLMVHIAGTTIPVAEIFEVLRAGDVATHIYNGNPENIIDGDGEIRREVKSAIARGVVADIAHATTHFDWRIARKAVDKGFFPDTISTDMHSPRKGSACYTLPTVMSKCLALGLPLGKVIAAVTSRPAEVVGRAGTLGTLAPGVEADVVVFDLEEGRFDWYDATDQALSGDRRIRIRHVLRAGVPNGPELIAREAMPHDPTADYTPPEPVSV